MVVGNTSQNPLTVHNNPISIQFPFSYNHLFLSNSLRLQYLFNLIVHFCVTRFFIGSIQLSQHSKLKKKNSSLHYMKTIGQTFGFFAYLLFNNNRIPSWSELVKIVLPFIVIIRV
ncbi:hypothetical protein BLOT_015199 [Blomia tropicalis]|nr:hypothetical protein BLOT_015199 [Blomia tropicalis]